MDLIKSCKRSVCYEKRNFLQFKSGDTITVAYRIKEGNKERIQQYRVSQSASQVMVTKKRFTVRKMSENVGVEAYFSRSNLRLSKASRLTSMVKYVALNCITCVLLPVRKQESKKEECNLCGSIAIRKSRPIHFGRLFVY